MAREKSLTIDYFDKSINTDYFSSMAEAYYEAARYVRSNCLPHPLYKGYYGDLKTHEIYHLSKSGFRVAKVNPRLQKYKNGEYQYYVISIHCKNLDRVIKTESFWNTILSPYEDDDFEFGAVETKQHMDYVRNTI